MTGLTGLNQSILSLSSRTETAGKAEQTGKRFSELQKEVFFWEKCPNYERKKDLKRKKSIQNLVLIK